MEEQNSLPEFSYINAARATPICSAASPSSPAKQLRACHNKVSPRAQALEDNIVVAALPYIGSSNRIGWVALVTSGALAGAG
jgi:hypothetical protein